MSLVVFGSVAFDDVETPFGRRERLLGGAATHFSICASFFTDVKLVSIVGGDFGDENIKLFKKNNVDVTGLKVVKEGKTFFWRGKYEYDLNLRTTLDTQLNVFADFKSEIPESYKKCEYLFLANIDPDLQLDVLSQFKSLKFVACDTMDLWIKTKLESLKEVIKKVNAITINDGELRELTHERNISKAVNILHSWGPEVVIVKLGQYGALMYYNKEVFWAPAMPLEDVKDPTGAGDTFAGGFMGYIAKTGEITKEHLRRAVIAGSVMASFNVEDFGLERMKWLTKNEINNRFLEFKNLCCFDESLIF